MQLSRKYYFSILGRTFSHSSASSQAGKKRDQGESTIDYDDISKYSQFLADWWDPRGSVRALHEMNAVRLKFITTGFSNTGYNKTNPNRPLEGIKLLDIGCGGGILSEALAKMGARVTGVDASEELITIAKEHAAFDSNLSTNLIYKNMSIEDLALEQPEYYDIVVASEILEHVNNQSLFLESCSQVLKPNGSIFVTTLNRTLISWLGAIVALEYILRRLPVGLHDWHKFVTPDETKRLLDKYNCSTKSVQGFFFNPATIKWSFISSTAIFYALHAVKREN